jgi:hypothetical protein
VLTQKREGVDEDKGGEVTRTFKGDRLEVVCFPQLFIFTCYNSFLKCGSFRKSPKKAFLHFMREKKAYPSLNSTISGGTD